MCGGLQGKFPDSVPDLSSKEDPANLGVSEEQVIQKAQTQLQHEEAGLKKLPTDQQAGPAPGAASHTAGALQQVLLQQLLQQVLLQVLQQQSSVCVTMLQQVREVERRLALKTAGLQ